MDSADMQRMLRQRLGLRVGPHVAGHVLRSTGRGGVDSIELIATDARSGRAVHRMLAVNLLQQAASVSPAPAPSGLQT